MTDDGQTKYPPNLPFHGQPMKSTTANRLLITVVVGTLVVAFGVSRNRVKVEGYLAVEDAKAISKGVRAWSSPRWFNDITLKPQTDGSVWAFLDESDGYRSITIFTNDGAGWKGTRRLLIAEDKDKQVKD
jgi:hypothetical protein